MNNRIVTSLSFNKQYKFIYVFLRKVTESIRVKMP